MSRLNRIKASIWITLQEVIRKNDYIFVSSKLNKVSNDKRKESTDLNDTDRLLIESILSSINETIENY